MALAMLGSFALTFAGVVLLERSVQRIRDSRQLAERGEFIVLGEVAKLPLTRSAGTGKVSRKMEWRSELFEESIDALRTSLQLAESDRDVRQLAVVSAVNGEGKTNVAVNLALSLARSHRELTLLIDADLRCPDIHRLFDTNRTPGLCQVLEGDSTLDEAIITDWSEELPQLHVLPAGKLLVSPHSLLGGTEFAEILVELRKRYRYVVIDTAPVLSASETLVIAKEVDGVVMCTLRNRSREVQVRLAHATCCRSHSDMLPFSLSHVAVLQCHTLAHMLPFATTQRT